MKRYSAQEIKAIRLHLKALLPRAAFEADPTKLIPLSVHVAVLFASFVFIGHTHSLWQRALAAIVAGHSLAVIAFFGHHLSHNAFVRQRQVRTALEYVVWTISGTPTTIWRKIHNVVHHRNTNTLSDPFRYYAEGERSRPRTVYSALLIPNRYNWFNPLIFLTPMVLHMIHGNAILFTPGAKKRAVITNLGDYSRRERFTLALDLLLIVAFQVGVFHLSGGTLAQYAWAGGASTVAGTMIAGTYVYSQHSLHGLGTHDDPFASTTLKLPRVVDWLHLHLSQHTAHHLFEGLNPDHLPRVTALLREHYPDALDERGPIACWRGIFRNPVYKPDPLPVAADAG